MQMWYNDSMISSSKRRAKGYRFDSHEHAASFVQNPAAAIFEMRTATHIIDAMDCQRKRI